MMQTMDERVVDTNGWFEIKANPIGKAGVFPYKGSSIGLSGSEADKIFMVFRPPEELGSPDCLNSFRLLPWIDNHVMLGPVMQEQTPNAMAAEKKGIQGVIGENVFFKDNTLFANIKVFSSTLAALIEAGKRELSAGYQCAYELVSGVWEGQRYDAVQRNIRGNHLALVNEGRMGPDVAVMDHLTFSLDAKEIDIMAEETNASPTGEMTLAQATALLSELVPQVAKLSAALAGLAGPAEPMEDEAAPAEPVADEAAPAAKADDGEGTPAGSGMDAAAVERSIIGRIAQRDALAKKLSVHIGTFDHADKTLDEVVAYGCQKLGIKAGKGQEAATLSGFLLGRPSATVSPRVAGMDSRDTKGDFVTKHLEG